MPRGVPNAKKDDKGMRYTTFHVPLAPNPKHVGTTYLKSESQSIWARNAARRSKVPAEDVASVQTQDQRRGSHVLVMHPGSRAFRIGRASDVNPISVPCVVARKSKLPVPAPVFVECVSRPRKGRIQTHLTTSGQSGDEYDVPLSSNDPFETKIAAITVSLRDRMRFYKLRVTPNAASIASTFNEQFKPEIIAEVNDPFRVDWIQEADGHEVLVGEQALRLADPQQSGYNVRWPIYGSRFNTRDYSSVQLILSDIESLLRITLEDKLNINSRDYKEFSVVLVIPDFYERAYVRSLVDILVISMGFKQICVQQESLAATYGAGISNACVVDIGAVTTSIACVDEGLVIADTRMSLNMGGDDITEFLHTLLDRINFPYRDLNLARWYDWNVVEDLKARLCTLAEGDVALNLYDFVVRQPGKPTEKYGLRAYDEIILAPMCIFEPRVIEFDRKRLGFRPITHPDITEEIIEHAADHVTQAMMISTQHLIPSSAGPQAAGSGVQTPAVGATQDHTTPPAQEGVNTVDETAKREQTEVSIAQNVENPASPAPQSVEGTLEGSEVAMDVVVDVEGDTKGLQPALIQTTQQGGPLASTQATYPGGFAIDVCFEASKLPLDVAIFNSARAAGGDDKIRKYLQAVLVIGGTALVPGMAHALESRLQAIATPLVPNMEKVQIIPPPKEVDPRVLAWKGAAVLGKMDGVSDLWLTATDWDILGMRGLKEKCFYL